MSKVEERRLEEGFGTSESLVSDCDAFVIRNLVGFLQRGRTERIRQFGIKI
jgi:hypothetical protein